MWPENAHHTHVKTNWRRASDYCAVCGESGSDLEQPCAGPNRCGLCQFYVREMAFGGRSVCNRYPPRGDAWPSVRAGNVCGEFRKMYEMPEREGK